MIQITLQKLGALGVASVMLASCVALTNSANAYGQIAESSGVLGPSPYSDEYQNISVVHAGDYVATNGRPEVYYVDADLTRHPFIDLQTFSSWQGNFDGVLEITEATLPTLKLGSTMPTKPGVTLVKIQSVAKVYAVTSNPMNDLKPLLQWITTEELAVDLYGAEWANFVVDISPTQLSAYVDGADVVSASDISVDRALLQNRMDLNGLSAKVDTDNDGLSDDEEVALGTDPNDPDTDHDGIGDWEEINMYTTDPLNTDSDSDGLSDVAEINAIFTDPLKSDTDSDGLSDGEEVSVGTSPINVDSDGDGIYDKEEVYDTKTDPMNADTDGDGYSDGSEVLNGYSPLS